MTLDFNDGGGSEGTDDSSWYNSPIIFKKEF